MIHAASSRLPLTGRPARPVAVVGRHSRSRATCEPGLLDRLSVSFGVVALPPAALRDEGQGQARGQGGIGLDRWWSTQGGKTNDRDVAVSRTVRSARSRVLSMTRIMCSNTFRVSRSLLFRSQQGGKTLNDSLVEKMLGKAVEYEAKGDRDAADRWLQKAIDREATLVAS